MRRKRGARFAGSPPEKQPQDDPRQELLAQNVQIVAKYG